MIKIYRASHILYVCKFVFQYINLFISAISSYAREYMEEFTDLTGYGVGI